MRSLTFILLPATLLALLTFALAGPIGCKESGKAGQGGTAIAQKTCVYDKNPIDQQYVYQTKNGRKLYFCSDACRQKFETDAVLNPDLKPDAM